ncbi:hypothetical protein LMH73_010620 [Vibrio splendidus]|nr:hypothetical protein [Vibrio splendidus]MCC4880400.1 hypothetical protein [Vibrio splendidus]
MTDNKQVPEKESTLTPLNGGVIFYPRTYVNDAKDPLESYAEGVTEGGKEIRVYIVPPETFRDKARDSSNSSTVPTIDLFSETHRTAMNPCMADEKNSKQTPNGILMIEQASIDTIREKEVGKPVIIGKWASVIQIDNELGFTAIGKGYLEINMGNKPTGLMVNLLPRFREILELERNGASPLAHIEEKRDLYSKILGERKKFFVSVIIKHEEIIQVTDFNLNNFRDLLSQTISQYTASGMYGGAMVRVREGNDVFRKLCKTCNHSYDYDNGGVIDPMIKVDEFLKYGGRTILTTAQRNDKYVLEIIPTQRINCARNGNERYANEIANAPMGESKTLKTYVEKHLREIPDVNLEKEVGFVFSNVALRLSGLRRGDSSGNIVLSAIHSFSRPLSNIYSIDQQGKPAYKMI